MAVGQFKRLFSARQLYRNQHCTDFDFEFLIPLNKKLAKFYRLKIKSSEFYFLFNFCLALAHQFVELVLSLLYSYQEYLLAHA